MDRGLITLYPLLLTQGLWAASRADRLPEASGPRNGAIGSGPPLRLLLVGDSSVAGVGADTQDEALSGQIARRLADHHRVSWQIIAKTGATAADTLARLDATPIPQTDVAILAIGVNDSKNGVTLAAWRRNLAALLDRLTDTHHIPCIVLSGLPPVERCPILPAPLRHALGRRARLFDQAMQDLARARPQVRYRAMDFPMSTDDMAPDGFHPGPGIYADWGAALAGTVLSAKPDLRPPLH